MADAQNSKESVSKHELAALIRKLLDKAGKDPRLTPRLLREKAEQRLTLHKGSLKPKRDYIKDIIMEWYDEIRANERSMLKAVVKLARVTGNVHIVLKEVSADLPDSKRAQLIRERLLDREVPEAASEWPDEKEIQAAQKRYEAMQDLKDIDQSLILADGPRKRKNTSPSASVSAPTIASGAVFKKVKREDYSDEEAEFS